MSEQSGTPKAATDDQARAAAKPFLKWAGGKQQLIEQFEPFFPPTMARYVEPFIGAGAVFFHLWRTGRLPEQAYLFDNNGELVNTYLVVRDQVDELIALLATHQQQHSREFYYAVRALDRDDSVELSAVERAARMLYLNRTCFNGLYRVNRKGQFNVPIGHYRDPKILHEGTLRAASAALRSAQTEACDFRTVVDLARAGDFIYFDPPYHPLSDTSSFTSYTSGDFLEPDQRDLAQVFAALSDKGCLCMLSNSYTPLVLELYKRFRLEVVLATRAINSKVAGRGAIREAVVLNY